MSDEIFPDSPFRRVKVVCPVADVLGKTERMSLIGDEHKAFRRVGWQLESFRAKIGDGLLLVYIHYGEGFSVEIVAHGEAVVGTAVLVCQQRSFHACIDYL